MFSNSVRRSFLVLCTLIVLWSAGSSEAKFVTFWTLAEQQAAIKEGGRANTIAIHPGDPNQMFVASESGGLFQSTDRGLHWRHVDSLPVIFTQAVAYILTNPNILLVSAQADFKANNGGGVWRSTDNGATWNQMQLTVPNFTGRLNAHEISIMPGTGTIVVGTSQGVFLSTDTGLTWTYSNVFTGDRRVFAVLATPGRIYAGGPAGVRIATGPPFSTWTSSIIDPGTNGGIWDIHAFGRSPLSSSHAFVVNGATELFRTENGGAFWTLIPSAPAGGGSCGGIAFVKAVNRFVGTRRSLDVYAGNRCSLHRLSALVTGTTANFTGTWQRATLDHADTRDLAFVNDQPELLGTDGGLHKPTNGGMNWTLTGNGRAGGFNALQVTEVKGQLVDNTHDIYIGTQDNNLWALNIWSNVWNHFGSEGFFIEAERRVPTAAESRITFRACGACRIWITGRHFASPMPFANAPGNEAATPTFVRRRQYVQQVPATTALAAGLALTVNEGQTWSQFAPFTQEPRDSARLGQSGDGDPLQRTIVYQPFRTNALGTDWRRAAHLIRAEKRPGQNGRAFFPAMRNFGSLGINPTMFAWYQVYGIDPGNAFHIIAPDVFNQRMMETRNGGEDWTEIPGLTNLVTDNGRLLFRTNLIGGPDAVFPVVTAVSFSPQNPQMVLIGTSEGGIFRSNDNGATWKKIENTGLATYITAFHWTSANDVFVSTYGRGLWRLKNVKIQLPGTFDDLCGGSCEVASNDGSPDRPPFAGGVMVFEGSILGARTSNGQLREVLVTPGSSVVLMGDEEDPQEDIVITESEGKDLGELEPLPKPPTGWIVKGLLFEKGDILTGTVFGDSEASLLPPISDEEFKSSTESPTKGKPYIRLITAGYNGVATVLPNEAFELAATDFIAGASYEVLIDGVPTKGTATADGNGSFTMRLTAPSDKGFHQIEVRMAGDETVIDGSTLLVRHEDVE
jgi:photosystem II stability/assembly factor-like uncharacterized protein